MTPWFLTYCSLPLAGRWQVAAPEAGGQRGLRRATRLAAQVSTAPIMRDGGCGGACVFSFIAGVRKLRFALVNMK